MRLNTFAWGTGDRVAVLLHGMLGAATQFHEVGPALADRGFRAIAVDLPGHGDSPRVPDASMELFVDAVLETVEPGPALAIGHSLGAVVLSEALSVLRPARAVYVDVPFDAAPRGELPASELRERFTQSRAGRQLGTTHPEWSAADRRVEAEAAARFDVETAVALEVAYARQPPAGPPPILVPSLLVRADPSRYVSVERAGELEEMGFCVRAVRGAGHSVWYGHLDEFMGVLDEWLA